MMLGKHWEIGLAHILLFISISLTACGSSNSDGPASDLITVYVNSVTGDDSYIGSKNAPKATINAAITVFNSLGLAGKIYVAGGTYEVECQAGTQIQLIESVSLYGGYSPTDWSLRDLATYETTILDRSSTGGAPPTPNRAIYAGTGITSATIIDGFTIIGGGGDVSSGIFVDGGSEVTIQNNIIDGGSGNTVSTALYNYSSSPTIQNNTIDGGSGATFSYGIGNLSSSSMIVDNSINGGSGSRSYGIINISDSPIIQGNVIDGGRGSDVVYGIFNLGASPTIWNNTIYGGRGTNFSHGIGSQDSAPIIRNNTINGGGGGIAYGIAKNSSLLSMTIIENNIIFTEDTGSKNICYLDFYNLEEPALFRNNALHSCSTALYSTGLHITDIGTVNALINSSGNVSADPTFVDINGVDGDVTTMEDNDWRLTAFSPYSLMMGGIDGGLLGEDWGYTTDKDGTTRTGDNTAGWSMGAYEYDTL